MILQWIARIQAECERIETMLRGIMDRLADPRQQDVPLHQRGFGVMDEPPA